MQVKNYKEPFYHSIIEDFYSDVELSDILAEIKDLKEHSLGPSETGDPRANTLMTAVQLDRHYINRRNDSKILTHNRKMFYLEEELKDNPFARYLPYTNDDVTQLNYYKDGAEYKHHADHGVLSAVTILHDEPKQYIGGDLVFTDIITYQNWKTIQLYYSAVSNNMVLLLVQEMVDIALTNFIL